MISQFPSRLPGEVIPAAGWPVRRRRRPAFTLIELLVVITVIGILMGLLIPTIVGVFRRSDDFRREVEISQLDTAIEQFKNKFHMYPPDLREFVDPATGLALGYLDVIPGPGPGAGQTVRSRLLAILSKISPNHQETSPDPVDPTRERLQVWWERVGVNLVATPSSVAVANRVPLGHETALWFWLSQLWDNAQFPITAQRNPGNPSLVAAGQNQRTFYEFQGGRLHPPVEGVSDAIDYPQGAPQLYSVFHFEQAGGGEAPYVYFHHASYGYAGYFAKHHLDDPVPEELGGVFPYMFGSDANPAPLTPPASGNTLAAGWSYANPDSYQIVCAGDDGFFGFVDESTNSLHPDEDDFPDFVSGADSFGNPVYGRNMNYRSQWDNIANFSQGRIETMESTVAN